MSNVIILYEFHGDSEDLKKRLDALVDEVVEMSSARPIIHLTVPREYGLMVADVWSDEQALRDFEQNPRLREILGAHGMPEPKIGIYPVHRLGWPVSSQPMYR